MRIKYGMSGASKFTIWADNMLLRVGLVRTRHYLELLNTHVRLAAQYEAAIAAGPLGRRVDIHPPPPGTH